MLSLQNQKKIEQLLIEQKLLTQQQLDDYKLQSIQKKTPLLEILVKSDTLDQETVAKLQAQASDIPYVNLTNIAVPQNVLTKLPRDIAETYRAVPFGMTGGRLAVAMLDPSNVQAVDFLSRKMGESLTTYMASEESIDHVLLQYAAEMSSELKSVIEKAEDEDREAEPAQNARQVQTLVQDAPITRALNTILEYAVNSRASDIHVEPREKDLHIRFRIDGVLQDTMKLPKTIEPALVSRIKILSNLKIDEHRVPQDGGFQVHVGKKDVDLRIAIAPITWGEQIVIRILEKDNHLLTLENLGFRGIAFERIKEGIHKPHGMVLSTGPTGSGKTTTMYAAIQAIKDVKINIVTLEDPIEYKMDGINQIQVNPDVGLTFANGLRSILRQDPNVVMVGEIRDSETANLAVQAALTGHIVLSTIHTNSAAGVLPRLLDMQVEPFLVASTVNTVIGQRLVRKVCDQCVDGYPASEAEIQAIRETLKNVLPKAESEATKIKPLLGYDTLPLLNQKAYTLYKGKGCKECKEGYKGRIGIYEVFSMSDAMERLLAEKATTSQIQNQAEADGMVTMKQDGYLKALNGITTLEEVARVASDF